MTRGTSPSKILQKGKECVLVTRTKCASQRSTAAKVRSITSCRYGFTSSAIKANLAVKANVKASHKVLVSCRAEGENGDGGKSGLLLSKAEVPAFIMRDDFLQQLYQWAEIQVGQQGRASFGYSMDVERLVHDGELRGFRVQVGTETTIDIGMDDEITEKYEFIARGPDGFPVPKGKKEEIKGKFLEIRKIDDNQISEEAKQAIKELMSAVMKAFDMYYAFGSVFVDDTT